MKLTPTQRDVLQKMVDGWGLYIDTAHGERNPGAAYFAVHGNDEVTVRSITARILRRHRLIAPASGTPYDAFTITEAGIAALKANP